MKKLLTVHILLIFIGLGTQRIQANGLDFLDNSTTNFTLNIDSESYANVEYGKFETEAKKNKIPHRKVSGLKDITSGYYAVIGVYGSQRNAQNSVLKLKRKGLNAHFLFNAQNKLNYVYLKHSSDWRKIIETCTTEFNGKYANEVWILFVENVKNTVPSIDKNKGGGLSTDASTTITSTRPIYIKNDSLAMLAKKNKIAMRTLTDLEGVDEGYYIIAGVYSSERNAKKSVKKLKRKGFDSDMIRNPENNNNYVYLYGTPDWRKAIDTCLDQFNGKYKDQIWILNVENTAPKEAVAVEEVTLGMLNELGKETGEVQLQHTPNKSRLIKKAGEYFSKMWYAEAAKLYEEALKKDGENYSYDIIQKVGDAHYFNTNMERAFHWYDMLYNKYGKKMSADNLFKYAHSLKGTGKYARAKRLMRLYNRKLKRKEADPDGDIFKNRTSNEMVLDNILGKERNFDIKNMAVNSKYSDFAPMFFDTDKIVFSSAMDSSVFNTRRYKWNDQPYLDLYVAKMNEESQDLKDALKFSKKINTKYHEAAVTFSPDNNTMYFTRNNYGKKLKRDKKGISHLKIYMSKKVENEWTEAVEVPFNSNSYSTGHPALSPDGKKLYFVSDMPGSIGETDIFVVDVLGNRTFSEPRNLGPDINTERKEMFPFINNKKLYFSSNGHTGLGGLDVYEATLDDEQGFHEVINVGRPVNSKKDDFSYIVDEETQKGFFASNRAGGKGDDDIYSFKRLVVEEIPENKNAIAGVVTELITGDLMPHALIQLLDKNGIKLKEVVTKDDGSFVFEDLEDNTKYTLKTARDKFFDEERQVATTINDTINIAISLKRLEEMIVLENGIKKLKTEMIHFNFDRSYIRKDASVELDKLVAVMNEYPDMVIKIESHTDSRGAKAYNRYLSNKRARSTKNYIISKGIDPRRIESTIGYGEDRLLNECNGTVRCSEAKHYLNRRSEFIIVKM